MPEPVISSLYPEGIYGDLPNSELIHLGVGIYMVTVSVNATVSTGADIAVELYLNGEKTGAASAADLSNQSTFFSAQFTAPVYVRESGSALSLYGTSVGGASNFTMQNSLMFSTRIR